MICAQAIVHFRPNESYEKYLKLLVSIMVLIQLFLPIGSFFFGDGKTDADAMLEQFRRELAVSIQEAEQNAREADLMLQQMTLEEVRRRAAEQQEQRAAGKEAGEEPDSAQESGEIRVEIDGIDPIKIGQED